MRGNWEKRRVVSSDEDALAAVPPSPFLCHLKTVEKACPKNDSKNKSEFSFATDEYSE